MKKALLIFLLGICCLAACAQDAQGTYGKTEAQILKMGWGKWSDFYQANAGSSTVAMVDANGIYATCLQHRNDNLLKQRSHSGQIQSVKELRDLMGSYGAHAVDMAENRAEGGTIWHIYYAGIGCEVETVIHGYLGGKEPKAKRAYPSDVEAQLDKLAKLNKKEADDKTMTEFKPADAEASLVGMRSDFAKLLDIAKRLPRKDSDRVIAFCLEYAKTATADLE